jgi:hypothetical protein
MAAITLESTRGVRTSGDVVTGALLASGAAALFVGTLFYARLTPELGLPAMPAERLQALADALRLGPEPWPSPAALLSSAIACCSRGPLFWRRERHEANSIPPAGR